MSWSYMIKLTRPNVGRAIYVNADRILTVTDNDNGQGSRIEFTEANKSGLYVAESAKTVIQLVLEVME